MEKSLKEKIEKWKERKGKFIVILCNDGIREFKKSGIVNDVVGSSLILKYIHTDKELDIPIDWIKHAYKVEKFDSNHNSLSKTANGGGL